MFFRNLLINSLTLRLYIDPGTGSMLFTILIGVLSAGIYALRSGLVKLRFLFGGGLQKAESTEKYPVVIFTDSKRYWNVFESICDEFERRGEALHYFTSSPDDPALDKPYEHVRCSFIGEGNKAFARLNMLKAEVLLSTTPGLDVYQWKRSRDVDWYVHIPHSASDLTLYHMFGIDYYDAILCSGEYQIRQVRKLEEIRHLPRKETVMTGITYFDAMQARLAGYAGRRNAETTVLLAPSWGASAILARYGDAMIDALLETGCHVIVRPHPQSFTSEADMMNRLMKKYPESEQLEWNRDNDNFDVLWRSDIMISDFSSVIFDFSLIFDKPVICADTSFDPAPYDACWLEEETWTFRTLPRIAYTLKPQDLAQLKSVIDSCLQNRAYQEGRETARRETWANPGKAAVLTVDYLLKKQREIHNGGTLS